MKWIGQHIWDFVSRFRNDVYLGDLTEVEQEFTIQVAADGKLTKSTAPSERSRLQVRNDEGSVIPAGAPLYSRGEIGGSNRIKVGICVSSDPAKMPCIGIAQFEMNTSDTKDSFAITQGVYNTNISGFTGLNEGDILYVNGGVAPYLTQTKPTNGDLIQNVGVVLKTNGTICQGLLVSAIGRTNDVPWPLYVDHTTQRVSIGTSSPTVPFHVIGDARIQGNLTVNGTYTQIDTDVNTTEQWLVTNDGTGPAAIINQLGSQDIFDVQDDGTSVFYIEDGGNVGIGTTSPSEILHLESTAPKIKLSNSQNSTGYYTTLEQNYSYNGPSFAINSVSGATARTLFGRYANNVSILPTGTGNVGIGTSSPSQKLDVVGSVAADTFVSIQGIDTGNPSAEIDELRVSGYGVLGRRNSGVYLSNEASGPLHFGTGGRHAVSTRMTIDSSGNVGIGTSSPARRLEVFNSSSSMIGQFKSGSGTSSFICFANTASTADQVRIGSISSNLVLSTNYTERMRINSSGNVGIGTTSPSRTLHVKKTGDNEVARFESDQTSSYVELEDANTTGQILIGTQGDNFKIHTAGTERFRIDGSGNVGIGTTSTNTKLHVAGVTQITESGNTAFYGGDYVRLFNHQNFRIRNVGGSAIVNLSVSGNSYFNGGNVGIGQTSPAHKLDVAGYIRSANTGADSTTKYSGFFGRHYTNSEEDVLAISTESTSSNNNIYIGGGFGTRNSATTIRFSTAANSTTTTGSERMRIDSSGNVGIGTTSPGNKLEVHSGTTNVTSVFKSSDNQAWVSVQDDDSGTYGALFGTDSDAGHHIVLADRSANKRLVINGSGHVGIGTGSPISMLHVVSGGSPSITIQDSDGTNQYATINHNNGANQYIARNNTSNGQHVWFGQTGTSSFNERMRIDSSGNVGIGTTSPSQILHVYKGGNAGVLIEGTNISSLKLKDPSSNGNIGTYNDGTLRIGAQANAGTSHLVISSSGNVGIGTATSSEKLEVNGNIKVGDGDRIKFGNGDDLQIYHDGSNSYIDDTGTGDLRVRTTNGAAVKIQYGAENMIQANANSSVDLYYDNSKKLETTSTGVEVTGDIAVSGSVQRQISTSTHTINFGAAGSSTQNYFLPFVQQAEQAAPNNTHRMVVPYDGIIKKVIVHSKVAFGSSAAVRYHRINNGNTADFANDGSTDDVTTDVTIDMSTAYTAGVFNFTTGNAFSAGDQIALSLIRGNTALGDVVVTVVYEYELF
ncbi:hypothetical protein N9Y26_00025 [bacterium]|nr:hypothetical protein [bacterium]